MFNFEFFGHPHTNKTDAGCKGLFERLELKLVHAKYWRSILALRRATYVLENHPQLPKFKRFALVGSQVAGSFSDTPNVCSDRIDNACFYWRRTVSEVSYTVPAAQTVGLFGPLTMVSVSPWFIRNYFVQGKPL
jgi:hypothetical protein